MLFYVILQVAVEPFWFSKGRQIAWPRRLLKTGHPVILGCLAGSNLSNPFQTVAWRVYKWIPKTKYHKTIRRMYPCQTVKLRWLHVSIALSPTSSSLCSRRISYSFQNIEGCFKDLVAWIMLGIVFLWISWRSHIWMLFLKVSELPIPVPECQSWQTAAFSRVCSALAMSTSFAALCSSQSWCVSDLVNL